MSRAIGYLTCAGGREACRDIEPGSCQAAVRGRLVPSSYIDRWSVGAIGACSNMREKSFRTKAYIEKSGRTLVRRLADPDRDELKEYSKLEYENIEKVLNFAGVNPFFCANTADEPFFAPP